MNTSQGGGKPRPYPTTKQTTYVGQGWGGACPPPGFREVKARGRPQGSPLRINEVSMQQSSRDKQRVFTASEVAEFEYCSLAWWHEQFEPLAQADTEELFARLVELEHEHGSQATALPEYDVIEQLLLRAGAFEAGRRQHADHAEEVAEIEEGVGAGVRATPHTRLLTIVMVTLAVLALLLIAAAVFLR